MRHRLALLLPAFMLPIAACSTTRPLLVNDTPGTTPGALGTRRATVAAYITRDGVRHAFEGYVEPAGDSLRFTLPHARAHGLERESARGTFTLARDSVIAVEASSPDVARTVLLSVVIAGALIVTAGIGLSLGFASFR